MIRFAEGRRRIEVRLSEPFAPFALLPWGTRSETRVRDIIAEGDSQMLTTVPGCLFECELSWDELDRYFHERRPLDPYPAIADEDFRQVGQLFRMDLPRLCVHDRLTLDVEGPVERGCFLGTMPRLDFLKSVSS